MLRLFCRGRLAPVADGGDVRLLRSVDLLKQRVCRALFLIIFLRDLLDLVQILVRHAVDGQLALRLQLAELLPRLAVGGAVLCPVLRHHGHAGELDDALRLRIETVPDAAVDQKQVHRAALVHAGHRQVRCDLLKAGRPVGRRAGILRRVDRAVRERLVAVAAVHRHDGRAEPRLDIRPVGHAADLQALDVVQTFDGLGGVVEDLGIHNAARERHDVAVDLRHDLVEHLLPLTGDVPAHVLIKRHAHGQRAEDAEAVVGEVGGRRLRAVERAVGDRLQHLRRRHDGVGGKALHGHAAAGGLHDRLRQVGRVLVRPAAGAPCALIRKIIMLSACSSAGIRAPAACKKRCSHHGHQHPGENSLCFFHVGRSFFCLPAGARRGKRRVRIEVVSIITS